MIFTDDADQFALIAGCTLASDTTVAITCLSITVLLRVVYVVGYCLLTSPADFLSTICGALSRQLMCASFAARLPLWTNSAVL